MVKLNDKKIKFKGKKKVKNVLEKKAKGLKLNKVDRKRIVKVRSIFQCGTYENLLYRSRKKLR